MSSASCPKCQRPVAAGRPACMYCGTKLEATAPCKKCGRPLLASAPKCSFCGTPTGAERAGPTASDVNRARTELFQAAERHRSSEQFVDALRLYQRVFAIDPAHARAYFGAARCLANLGRVDEALAMLERALSAQPDFDEARALQQTLSRPSARRVAVSSPAGFADAGLDEMIRRCLSMMDAQQWDTALAIFEGILQSLPAPARLSPPMAAVHVLRATCFKRMGRFAEALAVADDAVRCDPSHAPAWAQRGDLLDDLGRLDESIQAFDEAVRLDANNVSAWVDRGYVLRKRGRPRDALASYDRALALDPRHAIALGNKGNVLLELGQAEAAVDFLQRALAIEPKNQAFRASLEVIVRRGLVDRARVPILPQPGSAAGTKWTTLAEAFARRFTEAYGLELDFSPPSLRAFDFFMDVTFPAPDAPPGDDWAPGDGQKALILEAGAYLGEVLRRVARAEWKDGCNGNPAPYSTGVVVPSAAAGDAVLFPFMTVHKRLKYGEGALYDAYARNCEHAAVRPEGVNPADWTRHLARVADLRGFEEAVAFADVAIAIDRGHALAHFWKGMLESDLGIDSRPSLRTFIELAGEMPALAGPLPHAKKRYAELGAPKAEPAIPPGVPGPTVLESVANGGAAEAFCFEAAARVLPPGKVRVVSWSLHLPLREARELKVLPLVPTGLLAHGISDAREAVVGCFEPDASEVDGALEAMLVRAWTAMVAGRRVERVSFVGNKPWSARVKADVARANAELDRRRFGGDRLRLVEPGAGAGVDAELAAFLKGD